MTILSAIPESEKLTADPEPENRLARPQMKHHHSHMKHHHSQMKHHHSQMKHHHSHVQHLSHVQHHIHSQHRIINYLRISITDRCNLACRYCVPKDMIPNLHHHDIAKYEEIHSIVVSAAELGITKLRITGGEPLIRKGVFPFIRSLSRIDGIQDISLTTNGVLLKQNLNALLESGVNRINISLDTLKPERFKIISGRNYFEKVWQGIMAAVKNGLSPVKLNAVILRGINDDEIEDLARLSVDYPIHMRFIEYMPMGNSAVEISQQMLIPEIKERIEGALGKLEPVTGEPVTGEPVTGEPVAIGTNINGKRTKYNEAGPAKRFKIKGASGEIGFISPVSSHFCHECNRLRLTSTGRLRPCLLNNFEIDVLTPLRQGASKTEIQKIIIDAVQSKPAVHSMGILSKGNDQQSCRYNKVETQMSTIGG